jgi:hypothetical protein
MSGDSKTVTRFSELHVGRMFGLGRGREKDGKGENE